MRLRRSLLTFLFAVSAVLSIALPPSIPAMSPRLTAASHRTDRERSIVRRFLIWILDELGTPKPG